MGMNEKLQAKISPLRKRKNVRAWLEFEKWVRKDYKKICAEADTRWVVSIADTFVDYSSCSAVRLAAHQIVQLAAFEKLRLTFHTEEKPEPRNTKLWSGMRTYSMGPNADMVQNYLRRMKKNFKGRKPLWWMMQTVLMRMAMDPDSIFSLIDKHAKVSVRQHAFNVCRDRYCGGYVKLHKKMKYGTSAKNWKEEVCSAIDSNNSCIDFGCGQSNVDWPFSKVQKYDPAIKEFDKIPKPADWIICLDVLEHIAVGDLEPNLKFMSSLAPNGIFHIATRKAGQLIDGENAHCTVQQSAWWVKELQQYYDNVEIKSERKGHSCLLIAGRL